MTKEQFNQQMKELKDLHEEKIKKLCQTYAMANNPYKTGDVIEDKYGTIIKIESMRWSRESLGSKIPCMVYEGVELKKDHTPKKKKPTAMIWQTNLKLPTNE